MKQNYDFPRVKHLILDGVTCQLESQGLMWVRNEMFRLKYEFLNNQDLP